MISKARTLLLLSSLIGGPFAIATTLYANEPAPASPVSQSDEQFIHKAAAGGIAEVEMAMHAAIARGRQGCLVGGSAGLALLGELEQWCTAQHVRDPRRFSDVIAPGYNNG